eukprot:scaffold105779_cov42-Phaeocystis_antarctica.AAC.3
MSDGPRKGAVSLTVELSNPKHVRFETPNFPRRRAHAPVPRVHRLLNTRYRGPSWATCRGAHLLGSATKSPLYRVFKSRTCGALPDWSTAAK